MGRNKRWRRKAKRINGECHKYHAYCNDCKYVNYCFSKLSLAGRNLGIRNLEKQVKKF